MRGITAKVLSYAFLLCTLTITTSCEEFAAFMDNPVGSYLKIKTSSVEMTPGDTYKIQASTISTEPITYASSDPLVATVDADGTVKAMGDGVAIITISVAANTYYSAGTAKFKVIVSRTDLQAPLTLMAKEDGVISVVISNVDLKEPVCYTILRKTNGSFNTTTDIPVKKGDRIEFTSKNKTLGTATSKSVNINPQVECSVYGNVMSMISPDSNWEENKTITEDYALANLFNGAGKLVNDESRYLMMPATTLGSHCYSYMFGGCSALTKAPELPATTMTESCYLYMFGGCSSLEKAPELPAKELAKSCYADMFNGCSAMTEAPELPATTLADYCYYNMFSGCTALTKAPDLKASTLTDFCYTYMFYGCSKLSSVKCLATTGAKYALMNWLNKAGTDSSVSERVFIRSTSNASWVNSMNVATGASHWYVPIGWTIVSE